MQRNYSGDADSPNHDGAPLPADFVDAAKLILLVDVPARTTFAAVAPRVTFYASVHSEGFKFCDFVSGHFTRVAARFLQVLILRGLADSRGFAPFLLEG